ncbi:MAG: hypothetical protein ACK4ZM_05150, partial [bacterium]
EGCELELGKNYNYGRLYIDRENPVFYCFRCQTTGSIFKLLGRLGLDPNQYLKEEVGKNASSSVYWKRSNAAVDLSARKIFLEKNKLNLKIKIPESEIYERKKRYLRCRIGPDTIVENIPNLVLSITSFLNDNHIELSYRDRQLLPYFEKECIGFVGNRGQLLILRSIEEGQYHKINLLPKEHYGKNLYKDFYGVYTTGKGVSSDSVNRIILTEGIFDLLVGLKHPSVTSVVEEACFAAAALGSYYNEVLYSVLDYVRLSYVDLVIFSDQDKPKDSLEYKRLKENPCVRTLTLYYNRAGHDFGDYPILPVRNVFLKASEFRFGYKKKNISKSFR